MPGRTNRSIRRNSSWQEYQASLQRIDAHRKFKKILFKYSSLLTLLVLVFYGIAVIFSGTACRHIFTTPKAESVKSVPSKDKAEEPLYTKKDIQPILAEVDLLGLDRESFAVDVNGHTVHAETSLHIPLQQYLMERLDRSTSRDIGIVVMDPATGRIHALAGFDKTGMNGNPCFDNRFPAASIFKIVTAVAGIEKCGFRTGSKFTFNGGKYTLYKSQLKDRKNRYTTYISFQNSFAQSVNPVFGKIGANYLGKENLEEYGEGFGFNRTIDFEVPVESSHLNVTDRSYQWAEVASGFNRDTVMSPLHGALLCAAIVNEGGLVEPTMIDRITDKSGNILYRGEPKIIGYAATPRASREVSRMMMATVQSGTSRRAFRGSKRDKILSQLDIGGKTGSIGSRKIPHVRYDWFVGFANDKNGHEKLVVSVVVAHEKYIGKRAAYYARTAMKQYFRDYFDRNKVEMHTHNQRGNRKDKSV